jgi:hypothetical protein
MTDNELIVEALDHYFGELAPEDHEGMAQVLRLSSSFASKASVRPVESLATIDHYDMMGVERPDYLEARRAHKAGRPNADGTTEDTRFHPEDDD